MSAAVSVRCPKCKGSSYSLYERLEVAHVYEVEQGKAHPLFCSQDLPHQLGFEATCTCGHHWVPRYSSAAKIMDAAADAREEERP
jgi:hypothetical protein